MSSSRAGETGAAGPAITPIPELPGEFERVLPLKLSQAEDIQRYLAASPAWVRVESDRIARTLTRFAEAVVDAMESPRCAHDFLQQLDLRSISRDHNWRRIFTELVDRDPCFDGHKRTLIIRYLQFLSERKRLLDYVEAQHAGLEETAARVFDAKVERERATDRFELRAGETALIELRVATPAGLWLGSARFSVLAPPGRGRQLVVQGPEGYEKALRLGRNVVGRHPECDIVLNPTWRSLSRVHAILEWDREWEGPATRDGGHRAWQPGHLRITNLSPQGTAVAASAFEAPGDAGA